MNIVFIHYHLKTGGVTTVLRQQVETIQDSCRVLVLTGTPPESDFPAETCVIDGLDYDDPSRKAPAPEDIAESISETIHSHFGGSCDIVHIHNPTLAKNRSFLKILRALQKNGFTFFLQIHDFAEDGRPLVYFHEAYPADCHYGVINSRDYRLLIRAGLKPEGLHRVFNTVNEFDFPSLKPPTVDRILYPVRAIRRKNIGEAILLSLFFKNRETLAITQPPNSPVDFPGYESWKGFVRANRLNVEFEAGMTRDFAELVQTSRFLITTSITEGFGFSYLEPWLGDKLLWGRKLPEVCADFEANGIRLDHLYTSLKVPLDWIDPEKLYLNWAACVRTNRELFHYPLDDEKIRTSFAALTVNDRVDFGVLNEHFQKKIISKVLTGRAAAEHLIRLNPFLVAPGDVSNPDQLIENNHRNVLKHYNRTSYKKVLMDVYRHVAKVKVRQRIDKMTLLRHFLDLRQFSLLKWCDYAE